MTSIQRAQLHAVQVTLAVLDESDDEWRRLFEGLDEKAKDELLIAFSGIVVATALGAYGSRAAVAFRLRQIEAELSRGAE